MPVLLKQDNNFIIFEPCAAVAEEEAAGGRSGGYRTAFSKEGFLFPAAFVRSIR